MEPVPFILLLTLVRFLPSFLLFFIVFSKYLKYSKKATVLAFLFVVLIKSLEYYLLKHPLGKFVPQSRLILSILILIMSIVLFHKMINLNIYKLIFATVYKGNIIKNLIMDCQSYTKYRPNETTGGIFVSWRRKEELPTGA